MVHQEHGSPRQTLICHCFGHSVEEIQAQVASTGDSPVFEEIRAKCRQGLARCEQTNPKGSCCLGDVRQAIQTAQARAAAAAPVPGGRAVWLTTGGAVLAAVLSSACCWLPLLLIAFGASAAGVAGFSATYRTPFLIATGLCLATGYHLAYFRKSRCQPGTACATPNARLRRFNRVTLWIATAVALGFALFPNVAGALLGKGGGSGTSESAAAAGAPHDYHVSGLTCEACAANLRARLADLPGVAAATVSYAEGRATLHFRAGVAPPTDREILAAIEQAGYHVEPTPAHPGDETPSIPPASNRVR